MIKKRKNSRCPVLILGIGNILLRDEGIGPKVIYALEKTPLPKGVELVDGGTAGADLIDILADRQKVIIVDAVDAPVEPATILKLSRKDLITPQQGLSVHEIGLTETLIMTRQLNCEPKEVVIFGVKPVSIEYGTELSPKVKSLVPRLVELCLDQAQMSLTPGQ
jgi:hydrogenase maturation protease